MTTNENIVSILSTDYALTDTHIASYRKDGYVFLDSVLPADEMAMFRPSLVAAVDRLNDEKAQMERIVQGKEQGWKFVQNLWEHDETAKAFILAHRFGKLAADLMGVDKVRLFRDQSYFKQPSGGSTAWHQDGYFMPLDTKNIITMWVALSDVDLDMAPMKFFGGSHDGKYHGTSGPADEDMETFEKYMLDKGYPQFQSGPYKAGDATFHSGWTLHGSLSNTSDKTREAIVIVYYADGAIITLPPDPLIPFPEEMQARAIRLENLKYCLPGQKVGEVAATNMNPIVFDRGAQR
jgi:ectoine hydroxylase-related dioxygenase (phytanoyl-CoA dioxygenase family)